MKRALAGTEGVQTCIYLDEEEGFKLHFDPNVISLKKIFEKIKLLAKDRNFMYKSYVIPME